MKFTALLFTVTKQRDQETGQQSLLFQVGMVCLEHVHFDLIFDSLSCSNFLNQIVLECSKFMFQICLQMYSIEMQQRVRLCLIDYICLMMISHHLDSRQN